MCNRTIIIALCTLFACSKMTASEIEDEELSKKDPTKTKPSVELCLSPACLNSASRILSSMNSSVNPCDDFYEFACGNFAKSATIPSEYSRVSPSEMANQKVLSRFQQIIDDIDEFNVPKHFRLVKTFYNSCMKRSWTSGESKIDSAEERILNRNGWPLAYPQDWEESQFNYRNTFRSLFTFHFATDRTNSSVWIPEVQEKSPPLSRHYLKEGISNEVVQAYYQYMIDIAIALGIDESRAKISLNETLIMEIELYQVVFIKREGRDLYERFSKMTLEEVKKAYPYLALPNAVRKYGRGVMIQLDVETMNRVTNWVNGKSKESLANWEAWRWIAEAVYDFGDYFAYRTYVFNLISKGVTGEKTAANECIERIENYLGFALGVLYQREYIGQSSVDDLILMLDNIKQQFSEFIEKTEWLDVDTKRNAVEKVLNIKSSLATCRDFVLDDELETFYRDLELSDGSYEKIWANVTDFKAINEPHTTTFNRTARINCGRFLMKTKYLLRFNFIQFAAELYTDFFHDINRPKYLNYGAAGTKIGHQMAQSFGTQGRYYDKNGNFVPWSNLGSNEIFFNRTECFVDQYKKYTIDELNIDVNDRVTRNENVADNTGLKAAYHAYVGWANGSDPEKRLPGLDYSPNQMFWISMANSYCAKYRPEYLKSILYTGVHAPKKFRVNGPVSNLEEFSNDFKCDPGTKMNPLRKCDLW